MLLKPKAKDDKKLKFMPMGHKPDVENAKDAKQPGDKKEDAKKPVVKSKSKKAKTVKKAKTAAKANKAAAMLVG